MSPRRRTTQTKGKPVPSPRSTEERPAETSPQDASTWPGLLARFFLTPLKEARRRTRVLVVVGLALIVALGGLAGWRYLSGPPTNTHPRIAVFFPDPNATGDNYRDGLVQEAAFKQAILEADDHLPPELRPTLVPYRFTGNLGNQSAQDFVLAKMKTLYEDGHRVFIVTMSNVASPLRVPFSTWRHALLDSGLEAPLLISTVASAPGLANVKEGLLRYYVRSEDEAAELARFAAWKLDILRVAVFFITNTEGETDNAYGRGGLETFRDEFTRLGGRTENYGVVLDGNNAASQVGRFLAEDSAKNLSRRKGAFVVGFGDMLRKTVEELLSSGFDGPILCSSTLTVPQWQPKKSDRDSQIFTVSPVRVGNTIPRLEENVVYLFSKRTLEHALACVADVQDTIEFLDCWRESSRQDETLEVDHLSDGDAIIHMRVNSHWRASADEATR